LIRARALSCTRKRAMRTREGRGKRRDEGSAVVGKMRVWRERPRGPEPLGWSGPRGRRDHS